MAGTKQRCWLKGLEKGSGFEHLDVFREVDSGKLGCKRGGLNVQQMGI